MADDLPDYVTFLKSQPCAMQPCIAAVVVHHSTDGDVVAPGAPRPPKSVGKRRGKSQRASDYFGIPICHRHHAQFHDASGPFRDWTKEQRRAWQHEQVKIHRARYERDSSF